MKTITYFLMFPILIAVAFTSGCGDGSVSQEDASEAGRILKQWQEQISN